MSTPYSKVYKRFLDHVNDFFIVDLNETEMHEYCHSLMMSALANLKNIEHDLKQHDDLVAQFNDDLTNEEIEYISCMMAYEWVLPQLNNTTLTTQYIGSKDEKFFAPKNLIGELKGLRDDWFARAKKIRRDHNYENSEYFSS